MFTHLDNKGNAQMVDITEKNITKREARAAGRVHLNIDTINKILARDMKKGDIFQVARIAGIMAAKKNSELIPLCHNISIQSVDVDFSINKDESYIGIESVVKCIGKTGVEMEALTCVSVAALTIYDMCKAVDKEMVIGNITLIEKKGGSRGTYKKDMAKKGVVLAINQSTKKGVPKDSINEGEFIVDFGLKGDAHGGNWHRQVSFLGKESIDKMTALGIKGLCMGNFAENITTSGIVLYELEIGSKMNIGDVIFEVTQIGKECHKGCAIYHQVGDCIMPREGIFAKVLHGGIIKPGAKIEIKN